MSRTTSKGRTPSKPPSLPVRRIGRATFNRLSEKQLRMAGPRYSPGLDPKAPNLEIRSLVEAFDSLGFTAAFRGRIGALGEDIAEEWNRGSSAWLQRIFRGKAHSPQFILSDLAALQAADPHEAQKLVRQIARRCTLATRRLRGESQSIATQLGSQTGEAKSALEHRRGEVFRLLDPLEAATSFFDSPAGSLVARNVVLLLGSWGTGKTHSLCDLYRARRRSGYTTILCLAHTLPLGDPRSALARTIGPVGSIATVLRALEAEGRRTRTRALLCIDAINEGDRTAWKAALPWICAAVAKLPHVGLILSCRTPFEREILTPRSEKHLVPLTHPSFDTVETDAQLAFFTYYGIPSPPYPLIIPEFTRPLFLKLFCQSLQRLGRERKELFLGEVISGHAGMTTVLERMVKEHGSKIERDLKLPTAFCWHLLKGSTLRRGGPDVGLAPAMAGNGQDHVSRSECLRLIQQRLDAAGSSAGAKLVLQRLLVDGLLIEAPHWEPTQESRIFFPYQRFGEQLIARHLLRNHLNRSSRGTIRRSFYPDRPLGKVFVTGAGGWSYAMPGVASAIMLEFPEHVSRLLESRDRELVFNLPRRARSWQPFTTAFLDSLQWRHRDSFTETTDSLVVQILKQGSESDRSELLDALFAMTCRADHPYAPRSLWRYLSRLPMADRDLMWTETIRQWDERSSLHRLLKWCEANASLVVPGAAAEGILRALALTLSTTIRPLRDQITKALFDVGQHVPETLFRLSVESLAFNDPYVPERLLAASYGVVMRGWKDPNSHALHRALPRYAAGLSKAMFAPGAAHRTCHALMLGYCFGTIDIALRVAPSCIPRRLQRRCRPPLFRPRAPFRAPEDITDAELSEVEGAIHMDFDNYTLGRLVSDRRNYDSGHVGYQRTRRQILGRMLDLGYSKTRFESIDRMIGQWSWRESNDGRKTDRYGKKYSWIAFFEMYGLRGSRGLLDDHRNAVRPSDCDVDPSFPVDLKRWRPPLPDVFSGQPTLLPEWIVSGPSPFYESLLVKSSVDGERGPWVMLDGFIERERPNDPRHVFTFVKALLLKRRDLDLLRQRFPGDQHPGNAAHHLPEDHYTYAGEIPWSSNFGADFRTRAGRVLPSLDPLFSQYVNGRWEHGPSAEIPVHGFGWESYHSTLNQAGNTIYPSPALCDALGLFGYGPTRDLFDRPGRRASLYRKWNDRPGDYFRSHVFYMRRDLLLRYLRRTGQCLVWQLWGERSLTHDAIDRIHEPDIQAARGSDRDVFVKLKVYEP